MRTITNISARDIKRAFLFALPISAAMFCALLPQTLSAQTTSASSSESESSADSADSVASSTEEVAPTKTMTLSVEDAVQYALETHVDIQRSSLSMRQAEREYNHSWNTILPSIAASGAADKTKGWRDYDTVDTYTLSAGISASLSLDLGLSDKIKGLKSAYEAGKLSYEDTVRQTEFAVRAAFYNLLLLDETYKSAMTSSASYKRQYDQTQAKFNRGVSPELDLLTAQVNFETSKPEVESARSAYMDALLEFFDTIGVALPTDTEVKLSGSLEYAETAVVPADINPEESAENSLDVKILENSVESAEYARDSTRYSLYFPTLSLSAAVYPEVWVYDNYAETSYDRPYWNASLGITLPLDSWLPGSSARDSVASLDTAVEDYKLQLADKKKTVRTDIIERLKNIDLSKKTLETRHLNVELAQKSYQMTEAAYNRGTKDLLTLQSALDTLHTAELQLAEEQYNLITNILELENILGLKADAFFNKTPAPEETEAKTDEATSAAETGSAAE